MLRFEFKALVAVTLVGLSELTAPAQLVTYNAGAAGAGNSSVTPDSIAPGLSASLLAGNGLGATGTGTAFQLGGFSTASTPSGVGYVFSLTPLSAGTIDFNSATFNFAGFRSTGTQSFSLITDITGTSSNVGTVNLVGTSQSNYSISLSGLGNAGLVPITNGTTYTFLLDGYNSGPGVFNLNATTSLGGVFTPVPEPSTVLGLAACVMGLACLARHRLRPFPVAG